jgi:multicomponent Na+:H+ antiporter subunit D
MADFPPGTLLAVGAVLLAITKGRLQASLSLALPLISFYHLLQFDMGTQTSLTLFSYELMPIRVDRLALVWGYIFHLAAFLSALYALHVRDSLQHVSGAIYAGTAIGAVFAGDLITLFAYWELTAVSSVFLIWASRTESAYRAGMRYLIVQVGSGVILLSGILLHVRDTGSIAFGHLGLGTTATLLILIAFGIKCAFPFLHNWLQDAYPQATPTGTVFLSAFTTKLAVYALARGYAGTEILVYIGAVMTIFPVFFAVIENDLRRVLAYSLNNQLGFMVVGIGVGTELAINGTASHAFAHILYKALLFMAMGAVMTRVGSAKASDLGALYKSMPYTTFFCMIGAAAISAFPLFSGFVTKSLTMSAVADNHYDAVWFVMLFASAGVLHHSGIKIPYYGFFGPDRGLRCKEAPLNMLMAMGITAFFCVAIGVYPQPLYAILPYAVDYQPYTTGHVLTQMQLLCWALLSFAILARKHLEPPEIPSIILDSDWIYRKALPAVCMPLARAIGTGRDGIITSGKTAVRGILSVVERYHGKRGVFARTWTTSNSVLIVLVFLSLYLLLYL